MGTQGFKVLIHFLPSAIRGMGDVMGHALTVTRVDHTASELRGFAAKSGDGAQVRRLLAIALVLEGYSRTEAAALSGMDRQTLRDWVHRYNDEGIDGLKSRSAPGRAPALTDEQMAELRALVIQGPDPMTHKVVRWRCVDLRAEVARRFSVDVHESTIGKWLHQLGLTRLQPRPFHPKKDAAAQEAFKKRMARPVRKQFLRYDTCQSASTYPA
jgi:transposase